MNKPDWQIAGVVAVLLCVGLISIYSSSGVYAMEKYGSSSYFFTRQLFWILTGITAGFCAMALDHRKLKSWAVPSVIITAIFLAAVLVVGHSVGGAKRWLRIGGIGFQPSEFAKISLILFTAYYCDKKQKRIDQFAKGLLPALFVVGFICGLIVVQPDLGTPALIGAVCLTMLFLAGAKIGPVLVLMLISCGLVGTAIWTKPYRRRRFFAFLDPWKDTQGTSYQLVQSLLAMGSGGLIGSGLGNSRSKLLYLPEPHTDFIFPILAEEWGLLGSFFVLSLFAYLAWKGYRLAMACDNLFSSLLASGITTLILYQAIFNIAMISGCIPTKGLPLPFISFGGSSLVVSLILIGILLNISRFTQKRT